MPFSVKFRPDLAVEVIHLQLKGKPVLLNAT
jgi:hypothetical protein